MAEPGPSPAQRKLVLIGSGGHARVLAEAARATGWTLAGHLGPAAGSEPDFGPYLGNDDAIPALAGQGLAFALGFGFVTAAGAERRAATLARLRGLQVEFPEILPVIRHPSAIVSGSARMAAGSFAAAGAIIGPETGIGPGAIVNTGAIIDHDCHLGANCHAATGARLAGNVTVAANVLLGIGCILRQGIRIGENAVIAAGAVVIRDVPPGALVMGNPAHIRQSGPKTARPGPLP